MFKTNLLIIISLLFFLTGCKKEENISNPANSYWPLEIGNKWDFNFQSVENIDVPANYLHQSIKVIGNQEIDGRDYFKLKYLSNVIDNNINSNVFVREDTTGLFLRMHNHYEGAPSDMFELNILNNNPSVGDVWEETKSIYYNSPINDIIETHYTYEVKDIYPSFEVNGESYPDVVRVSIQSESRYNGLYRVNISYMFFSYNIGPVKILLDGNYYIESYDLQ